MIIIINNNKKKFHKNGTKTIVFTFFTIFSSCTRPKKIASFLTAKKCLFKRTDLEEVDPERKWSFEGHCLVEIVF